MKAASARSKAGSLDYLKRQEKHAKREDRLAQKRRDEYAEKLKVDPKELPGPLVHGTLDLVDALEAHLDGVKKNSAAKNVALHMIVRFPPEVLEGEGAGKIVGEEDERKQIMLDLAVKFVNDTHGGNAVFAARMDRDEEGQSIVDVFYAPVYEKRTKRTPPDEKGEMWVSLTKFAKELAQKHEPVIRKRLMDADNDNKLTSPRAIGIAIQEELALFMKNEVGLDLDDRNEKLYLRSDWKSKEEWQASLIAEKVAEAVSQREHELDTRATDLTRQEKDLERDQAELAQAQVKLVEREAAVDERDAGVTALKLENDEKARELDQALRDVEAKKEAAAAAKAAAEGIEKEATAKAAAIVSAAEASLESAEAERRAAAADKAEAERIKAQEAAVLQETGMRARQVKARQKAVEHALVDLGELGSGYTYASSRVRRAAVALAKLVERFAPSLPSEAHMEVSKIVDDLDEAGKVLDEVHEKHPIGKQGWAARLGEKLQGIRATVVNMMGITPEPPVREADKPSEDDTPSYGF